MENLEVNEQIKDLYVDKGYGSTTIANMLNISESTIRRRLAKMGVKLRKKKKLDEEGIVNLYLSKVPIYVIADKLRSSQETISKIIKKNNIEVRHKGLPKFNENIFDIIDTEEKAYWLGFIFADGYIATINPEKPNYAFEISLKSEDFEHLNKFNLFSGYDGNNTKIYRSKRGYSLYERCRWSISNKHLWSTLNNYGCTPRKSLTLEFPSENIFKDKGLIRHFIRGYFDGDGGISFLDKEHHKPTAYFCGSLGFLEKLEKFIPISLAINNSSSKNAYVISTSCRKAMKLLHYLYDNCSIYLNRKYELFNEFCRSYEESYELLESKNGEGCNANPVVN